MPSQRNLPNPGIEPESPVAPGLQAVFAAEPQGKSQGMRDTSASFEGSEFHVVCWSVSSTLNFIMERCVRIGKSCVLS